MNRKTLKFSEKTLTSIFTFMLFYLPGIVWAQVPRDIPSDTGPLEVDSTFDYILYIILPLIVIILFIVYLVNKKKKERDNEQER